MHEHGREDRRNIADGIGKEPAGNESPSSDEGVPAAQLHKEEKNVQSDHGIRDYWKSSAAGIIIADG
jgi:hypothetical protein